MAGMSMPSWCTCAGVHWCWDSLRAPWLESWACHRDAPLQVYKRHYLSTQFYNIYYRMIRTTYLGLYILAQGYNFGPENLVIPQVRLAPPLNPFPKVGHEVRYFCKFEYFSVYRPHHSARWMAFVESVWCAEFNCKDPILALWPSDSVCSLQVCG